MKRQLCITVLFALVLIPDWASAYCPPGGQSGPVYYVPVYYAYPPVYCQPVVVQPYVPVMPPMLQPPRVEAPKAGSSLTDSPRPIARPTPALPTRPPVVEPVRPAGGGEVPPTPARPNPAPAPAPSEPKGSGFEIPKNPAPIVKNPDNIPPTTLPMTPGGESKLPKLEFPTLDPKLPSLELPKVADPKLPSLELPAGPGAGAKLPSLELPGGSAPAVPVPAPAPDVLIPKAPDALPPLTLPPDTPVTPPKVEVKSSPLGTAARELKVSVFPAAGAANANGLRKVGFFNHTDRDLSLTIEGKAVTLPAMSYLHAQLPPTFTWKCADKPAAQATVPADATGLDVLIRE